MMFSSIQEGSVQRSNLIQTELDWISFIKEKQENCEKIGPK